MREKEANGSASALISQRFAELGDWRAATLSRIRALVMEADPEIDARRKNWATALQSGAAVAPAA
ncbi:hypothetical protein DBR47_10765 [Paucibacter sp. KBW04]|uniref:hypothetical protein n=1 Tax=Paucibacter sp. KBW04 TaxID=2153361 RepID=UPI000FA6143B|nr:hypothetical protein [Paucibacter sp. KBW04]RQO59846.1 hypothetical protein DBR47_10765 [Paucibacter sp. KBW04]